MTEMSKPEIEPTLGEPPLYAEFRDLVEGSGPVAEPGATVEVHYVGVDFETGEEFDSSWSRGETITFHLRGLVRGWQEGIPSMKVGGRRELICPPDWAYGPAGGGHPLSGRTLVFVVDLVAIH